MGSMSNELEGCITSRGGVVLVTGGSPGKGAHMMIET